MIATIDRGLIHNVNSKWLNKVLGVLRKETRFRWRRRSKQDLDEGFLSFERNHEG